MDSQKSNPFHSLQINASGLFSRILARYGSEMACNSGCASCCAAEFSIHPGEAALILEDYLSLEPAARQSLLETWKRALPGTCAFLVDNRCTTYGSRPVICRTQGAPLCTSDELTRTKRITACPLNFNGGETIPSKPEDWFELNRLAELQSVAEQFFEKTLGIPVALQPLLDANRRIPLRSLRDLLARLP
jgi:hypothetical protein